ncbi:MAG: hypothetical protein M0Q48_02670 [Verrucomicrobia bacterium]|nr:hypothetical protein [Verrucomicrobiota bacterium]NCC60870.1 hypothetical protein [Verrucomicrobiae bacterium]
MKKRDHIESKLLAAARSIPPDERLPVGLAENVMAHISSLGREERFERDWSRKVVLYGGMASFLLSCLMLVLTCVATQHQLKAEQSRIIFSHSEDLDLLR